MTSLMRDYPQVSYEDYGPNHFVRDMSSTTRIPESGQLAVMGKEILERTDGDIRGVIASVDARSFISLICAGDERTIKRHLFDDNLRVFLGSQGGYNPSIIETASSENSYLFWYLNNGVTITCKNFSYNKGHSNPILRLENFQIVNGAQTSHSLLEAYNLNRESFENVVLMVRVYATERADIAERVAVATNSQARIQSRDLRANHPTLKKLELAFMDRGYFFERKRNMHISKPGNRRIDALKLGQIILAYYLKEPDKAKSDSDNIFDARFHEIFHERLDVDDLVNVVALYQIIEDAREEYTRRSRPESGHIHQYLVYGHWFILFACKLLLRKDKADRAPTGDAAKMLVEKAIALVASACDQQKAVAHYQMFRSSRSREKIAIELGAKQIDFFELLVPEPFNATISEIPAPSGTPVPALSVID